MFVYGCSGGGVLTSWVVGHTDRFAAASANCPVPNWLSFVGTTASAGWYRNFKEFPWDDPFEHLRPPAMLRRLFLGLLEVISHSRFLCWMFTGNGRLIVRPYAHKLSRLR